MVYGVVFDMDGTLTNKGPSSWAAIDEKAISNECLEKLSALRSLYLTQALEGTLSEKGELDWLIRTLQAYIDDGMTIQKMHAAVNDFQLRPGVIECLKMLEKNRIPMAIVSYGIKQAISRILLMNGLPKSHRLFRAIYAARFTVMNGSGPARYVGYETSSLVIPSNKGYWSDKFALSRGIDPKDLLAVGDSGGDRFLCRRKRNRVGLAADKTEAERLRKFMGRVIITDDFEPVTKWLTARLGL